MFHLSAFFIHCEGWGVKNLSSFVKEIVPISLNPYFFEASLVAGIMK